MKSFLFLISILFTSLIYSNSSFANTISFPKYLLCPDWDGNEVKLYTRLHHITNTNQIPTTSARHEVDTKEMYGDETARGLGDYFAASLGQEDFNYKTWTCDSWDYDFTFSTSELINSKASMVSRKLVHGQVKAEVRSHDMGLHSISCTAHYE